MDLLQNIKVKELIASDFDELKMFHVKHFKNYTISNHSFETYLTQSQYKVLGAFHVKHLVGYGIFLQSDFQADIIYIATHPDYRKQGIGSKILREFEFGRKKFEIFLEVDIENTDAISFYFLHKFEIISIRKKYLNGKDAYLMKKILC